MAVVIELVMLRDGGIAAHTHARELLFKAARGIVEVPARHDEQQRATISETWHVVVGEPCPGLVAHDLGAGFGAALDRIIDATEIKPLASDRAHDSRVAEESLATSELDDLAVLHHAALEDRRAKHSQEARRCKDALQSQVRAQAEAIRERTENDFKIAIEPNDPGQEIDDHDRLAVLAWSLQQQLGAEPGIVLQPEPVQLEGHEVLPPADMHSRIEVLSIRTKFLAGLKPRLLLHQVEVGGVPVSILECPVHAASPRRKNGCGHFRTSASNP